MIEYLQEYFTAVCEAYSHKNIELSYNKPIISLLEKFGCKARDMSGERSGAAGENIDIKSSGRLAEYMAVHAKTNRAVIAGILKENGDGQPLVDGRQKKLPMFGELHRLYRKIKMELHPQLDTQSFADMYGQMPPANYLAYIAMRRHSLTDAQKDLADKSKALLMKEWTLYGHIHGNCSAGTGMGCDPGNSDRFCHS